MMLDKCPFCGNVNNVDRHEYDGVKLLTDDGDDDDGNDEEANKCDAAALPSSSVSANALRFRIRSTIGEMYMYGL